MRRKLVLVWLVILATAASGRAQSLDDQYLQIFNLIQEADSLAGTTPSEALAKYLQAQTALQRLQKASPDWNSKVINFRLIYVGSKIVNLSAKTPPPEIKAQPGGTNAPTAQPGATAVPKEWEASLNGLKQQIRQLQADKVLLESKLKEALAMQPAESDPRELARSQEKVRALQKENELLKAAVQAAKEKPAATAEVSALTQARQELGEQKQLFSKLTLENEALETRLRQSSSPPSGLPPFSPSDRKENERRIKQLEQERNDLQRKLEAANKDLSGKKGKVSAAQEQNLQGELLIARARLQALEARAVPYSKEELALLKTPEPQLAPAEAVSSKKSDRSLPPGSAQLVAEAKTCFAAKQYDKAEAAYMQILKQDPQSVPALANLAAIQIEAQHFEGAERNIQLALRLEPNDPYNLYVLGLLRLRQTKYDAALDCFSHCAQLEPQNAEVQNYLGLALSEKGMRVPAEAALRKAIQLQPGYAGAHYNLAIIYLNQKPPARELARWHYQKAVASGQPRNSELEKKLALSQ
jgi:Flp pilus assembly protein TadD